MSTTTGYSKVTQQSHTLGATYCSAWDYRYIGGTLSYLTSLSGRKYLLIGGGADLAD